MAEIRTLCWNIFHGRDAPPDPSLFTLRSKLLRITEAGETTAVLDVGGSSRDVAYADVRKARIEVEFNRKED